MYAYATEMYVSPPALLAMLKRADGNRRYLIWPTVIVIADGRGLLAHRITGN